MKTASPIMRQQEQQQEELEIDSAARRCSSGNQPKKVFSIALSSFSGSKNMNVTRLAIPPSTPSTPPAFKAISVLDVPPVLGESGLSFPGLFDPLFMDVYRQ